MASDGGWSVAIDRDTCMGAGVCVLYAPGTFVHDESTIVTLLPSPSDPLAAVRAAVEGCPTGALQLIIEGDDAP